MISIIKNEYIKIGYIRLMISIILLDILTIFLYKYNELLNEYIFIVITFIGLDLCILFSGIISNEYDSGTFRYYLSKPIKRYKIFICKFISILIYLIILIVSIIVTYLILLKMVNYKDIIFILKSSIPLLTLLSIIILVSTIFKNNSLSTSFSISLYILSNLISQILFGFNFRFIEYTFFPYLDYSIISDINQLNMMNNELGINLSLNKGIIIDICYFIILFILSLIIFNKKDIKN